MSAFQCILGVSSWGDSSTLLKMPNPAYNVLALLTAAPYQRQINTSVHPRILNSWLRISLARSHGVVVGAGAAVPSEGEDRGEAEVLPERPQADVPQGALRRDHLRRHPPRAGCVEHVPRWAWDLQHGSRHWEERMRIQRSDGIACTHVVCVPSQNGNVDVFVPDVACFKLHRLYVGTFAEWKPKTK